MTTALGRCCEEVADFTGFHWSQCSRAAVVVEDDKPYCTQHRPSVVRARRAKATAAFEQKEKAIIGDHRKLSAFDDLLAAAEDVVGGWGQYHGIHVAQNYKRMTYEQIEAGSKRFTDGLEALAAAIAGSRWHLKL